MLMGLFVHPSGKQEIATSPPDKAAPRNDVVFWRPVASILLLYKLGFMGQLDRRRRYRPPLSLMASSDESTAR